MQVLAYFMGKIFCVYSFSEIFSFFKMVGEAGFEPAAFGFGGQHSIQLSYPPIFVRLLVITLYSALCT